ncbi:translation initiation factor IF-2 N-terminal domain-containing protein [Kutzneria sp. CA-103260]|uniref:translation initiation factor IF-2 N-terminal domain-containing protein n=1 Tax=Kutzneria sp. CA-103260 TaxID=2802641 RepID=UPI001BAC71BA|nr:translation initiation factor IF-2 N-terminal domain-containing protein [Kutzneria sp. CA-103260]QUQ68072.1 Ribonuclease E [Kutzneria sp. CA-103260]
MSKKKIPAGGPGGDGTTPIPEFPPKLRVHALAKALDTSSREVLAALADLGEVVRSPQSSVSREVAEQVAATLLATGHQDVEDDTDEVLVANDELTEALAERVEAEDEPEPNDADDEVAVALAPVFAPPSVVFMQPTAAEPRPARRRKAAEPVVEEIVADDEDDDQEPAQAADDAVEDAALDEFGDADDDASARRRRRRGRRGRGRGKGGPEDSAEAESDEDTESAEGESEEPAEAESTEDADADEGPGGNRRRRRRRRRKGGADEEAAAAEDDPPNTVVHVRNAPPSRDEERAEAAAAKDEVRSVRGSTRLEAKRQRRRDGREAGRRRVPILSEAEFLARREAVARKMVVRERGDRTQIAVLEDGVLVEHFVTSAGTGSLVGNVYLGRVQNVLPSMEAAFVDIGRGRNAVLYAGEVDWDAAGLEGKARKIEQALSTGDSVLVQVTKDPVGHKGARLTTQISLPGRFLVYVPGGGATGISRKLPDNERKRLKDILKRVVPEDAGVIIRTASEGIAEEELGRDVRRLQAQWEVIKEKADAPKAQAPQLLYEEPDLLVKVVRDLFTEDFSELVVQGEQAWDTIDGYVRHVAPDLADRLRKHVGLNDVFTEQRIDEQITKALDRKVWLPSGGYLIIDRTEAMTVIDVNTGKFTGSGGNLEETVTRNNLESAEEIVRQLRLRDIGGIIVIDFIDMVLESNRDLVLRRLTECLGRDRTRHQVAEVTSLGLVQMTRKRVGTGLLEAFSQTCEHCRGRGVVVSTEPLGHSHGNGNGNGQGGNGHANGNSGQQQAPAEKPAGSGRKRNRNRHRNDDQPAAEVEPVTSEAVEGESAPASTAGGHTTERVVAAESEPAAVSEAASTDGGHTAEDVVAVEAEPAAVGQTAATAEGESTPEAPAAAESAPADAVSTPAAASEPAQSAFGWPAAAESAAVPAGEAVSTVAAAAVTGQAGVSVPYEVSEEPVAVATNGHHASEPEPVVSTTRRRRRAASRPAGPPSTGLATQD